MPAFLELIIQEDFVFPSTSMVRKELFFENKYNLALLSCADYDFFVRIAMKYKVGCMFKPLVIKRESGNSVSNSRAQSMLSRITAMNSVLANRDLPRRIVKLAKIRKSKAYYFWSYSCLQNRDCNNGAKYSLLSLRNDFTLKACKLCLRSITENFTNMLTLSDKK